MLCNAVEVCINFPGKKRYEGYGSTLLALRRGVKFPGKKRYVGLTVESLMTPWQIYSKVECLKGITLKI